MRSVAASTLSPDVGWGDEIMASALARREHVRTGRRVKIVDRHDRVRSNVMWDRVDYIAQARHLLPKRTDIAKITNGPGCRHYLDYEASTPDRWKFLDGRPLEPGEIVFSHRELAAYPAWAGRFVVLEPHIKPRASPNKQWGWERWERLAEILYWWPVNVFQLGPPGTRRLRCANVIETTTFRDACVALSGAVAAVLPDGGLHHAAAALGVPAVVIWGGFTSPRHLGYSGHVNLADDGPESPCGYRTACGHCRAAMRAITPEAVAAELGRVLDERSGDADRTDAAPAVDSGAERGAGRRGRRHDELDRDPDAAR